MKNDELLEPYNSALVAEQDASPTSLGYSQALDKDDPLFQLKSVKVATVTLDHSLEKRMLTETDTIDEPLTVQDTEEPVEEPHKLPLETLPLPAFQLRYITLKDVKKDLRKKVKTRITNQDTPKVSFRQRIKTIDRWLVATFLLACIVSGSSLWYFFAMHQTLLYGDANAHLLIARRVLDNLTPGLAQLGAIWLPLPHLLMVPLVWNDFLWRTGLAGSIVSMVCYLIATVYIFLSARRLTNDSFASFLGTLVFILNPNILYLQSTPLSELVFMGTLAATCYYFLIWAQTDSTKYLILTAGAMFLTTLSRYDGWFVFATVLALIFIIGLVRRHRWTHIEGNLFIFASMGSLGILLWFIWNFLIFGDPLYFQRSTFSSQAQQRDLINSHILYTYHDVFQSIRFYLIDCIDTVGLVLFGVGVLAFLVFLAQRRLKPETFAALIFVSPIAFYIISLYGGQAALYLPNAVPGYAPYTIYNVRYGEVVVMPVAIFMACLVNFFSAPRPQFSLLRFSVLTRGSTMGRYAFPLLCLLIIVGQSVWIASTGIITLQDGEYGLACIPTYRIVVYMAQHYNGGRILQDLYTSKIDTLEPTAGIYFKNMIYEGSGQLWTDALSHPESVVDWIIVNPTNPNDAITNKIDLTSPAFTSDFTFVVQEENGLALYHRNGLPPLPTYDVPRSVFTEHQLCGHYDPRQLGNLPELQGGMDGVPVDTISTSTGIQQDGKAPYA